jgi:hypothetical protein
MKMTPEVFTTLWPLCFRVLWSDGQTLHVQRLLFSPIRARISAWISSISIIQTLCFYQTGAVWLLQAQTWLFGGVLLACSRGAVLCERESALTNVSTPMQALTPLRVC